MTTFWGQSDPSGNGKFSLGTEHNVLRFRDFLKKHPGIRLKIDPYTPESREQRGFFEGAVIPFITYFQENLDYTDPDHLKRVRGWLLQEFNSTFLKIAGKAIKVPKSSKGELNRGLLERIMDWSGEQGYPIELLNPDDYKRWRDEIAGLDGPRTYIEYLESIGKLHRP